MTRENGKRWWGKVSLEVGESLALEIAPLALAVQRRPQEWLIGYQWSAQTDVDSHSWTRSVEARHGRDYAHSERFIARDTGEGVALTPLLADRPVVIRPLAPLHLPPGEAAKLFVSSPLWVGIEAGARAVRLMEIPIVRPSDTWFGPTTREGELCYASQTRAQLNLEELVMRPHRAMTPVMIRNEAEGMLLLERFSLPAPLLTLYGAPANGFLWTQPVTLTREKDAARASLSVQGGPPEEAPDAELIKGPRREPEQGILTRALGTLFG